MDQPVQSPIQSPKKGRGDSLTLKSGTHLTIIHGRLLPTAGKTFTFKTFGELSQANDLIICYQHTNHRVVHTRIIIIMPDLTRFTIIIASQNTRNSSKILAKELHRYIKHGSNRF